MNLAVNARDTMPSGGRLEIETSNTELGPGRAGGRAEVEAGSYIMLRVHSPGRGIGRWRQRRRLVGPGAAPATMAAMVAWILGARTSAPDFGADLVEPAHPLMVRFVRGVVARAKK